MCIRDRVYLWQEVPERQCQHDHGIDIVARDIHTGGWCAVQCKFYDPAHHVSKGDICLLYTSRCV